MTRAGTFGRPQGIYDGHQSLAPMRPVIVGYPAATCKAAPMPTEFGQGLAVTDNVHVTTPPPDDAMTG